MRCHIAKALGLTYIEVGQMSANEYAIWRRYFAVYPVNTQEIQMALLIAAMVNSNRIKDPIDPSTFILSYQKVAKDVVLTGDNLEQALKGMF